jgi:hypothetical protein
MKYLNNPLKFILLCIVLIAVANCETQVYNPELPEIVSFERDVQPILARSCVQCHQTEENPPPLLTPELAYSRTMSGGYVIPGNAEESLFYKRLIGDPDIRNGRTMPPAEMLPDAEIRLIKAWIEQGAQNN